MHTFCYELVVPKGKQITLKFPKGMKTDVIEQKIIDFLNASCSSSGNCKASVDFYKSDNLDLKLSFGRATIEFTKYENNQIKITGFSDTYNFDPKPWGVRSIPNEIITRGYDFISSGKPFRVCY